MKSSREKFDGSMILSLRRRSVFLSAMLCAAGVFASQSLAAPLEFQPLGYLPGGSAKNGSSATGVSTDGKVVVGSSDSASGTQAFRWTSAGGMQGLGDLPGGLFRSTADNVSPDGATVVGKGLVDTTLASRWTSGTGMIQIDSTPTGYPLSAATGVSTGGTTIVGNLGSSSFSQEAYRWTSGGGTVGLGDLPGGEFWSVASDVSADGSLVVGHSMTRGSMNEFNDGYTAFRWTQSGGMVPLDAESASAVSASGNVIVGRGFSRQAIRWTLAGGSVDLGDLPGGSNSSGASGVSDDGKIVVGVSRATDGNRAFLWKSSTGMVDLRTFLIANGATGLDGWVLQSASDISGDGNTIVGIGINPSGNFEAWVATIPEPSTFVLAVLGMLGIAVFRCRKR